MRFASREKIGKLFSFDNKKRERSVSVLDDNRSDVVLDCGAIESQIDCEPKVNSALTRRRRRKAHRPDNLVRAPRALKAGGLATYNF